jgi:hypothetical protein
MKKKSQDIKSKKSSEIVEKKISLSRSLESSYSSHRPIGDILSSDEEPSKKDSPSMSVSEDEDEF